jgi:ABC transporter substrate binding protein
VALYGQRTAGGDTRGRLYLSAATPNEGEPFAAAFRRGLQEAGYVVGQNVAIEYRWAEQQIDRLPAMATDLVQRHVNVIAAVTTPGALAAQAATTTVPIVFETGSDPVRLGLIVNLSRPGGNVTGVSSVIVELAPKRLELLHELLPTARVIALLVNPADRALAQTQAREVLSAAHKRGLELHVLNVSSERDFDAVFADVKRLHVGGIVIGAGSVFLRGVKQACCPDGSPHRTRDLSVSYLSCGWRSDELRIGHFGQLPLGRDLYRKGSQGRKSR